MTGLTGWRLWLAWTLTNGLAGLVAFPAGGAAFAVGMLPMLMLWPATSPRPWLAVLLAVVWAPVWPLATGAVVAAVQWRLLRRVAPVGAVFGWVRKLALLWLVGTILTLGLVYLDEVPRLFGRGDHSPVVFTVGGALLGLVVGIGQWLDLDRVSARAWSWLVAVPLGYAAGAASGLLVVEASGLRGWPVPWYALAALQFALGGLVGGLVSGAASGLALVWLLSPEAVLTAWRDRR